MLEPIRLSALGRNVEPGNLYDYFTDKILPGCVQVHPECKQTIFNVDVEVERSLVFTESDRFKTLQLLLGINSHLRENIAEGVIDLNSLWFHSYLNPAWPKCALLSTAEVTIHFRVVHGTGKIDQNFLSYRMLDFQMISRGRATHVVEEVKYGVELICSIHKFFNPSEENKEDVEESIYSAAKLYFDQQSKELKWAAPPTELTYVSCLVMSSIEPGEAKLESFQQSCIRIRETIFQKKKLRPVSIVLRCIPARLETKLFFEKIEDNKFDFDKSYSWIVKESRRLKNHPKLDRIPPLEKVICHFQDSLGPLLNIIEKWYAASILQLYCHQEQNCNAFEPIIKLLTEVIDWLKQRREDMEKISSHLNESNFGMFSLEDIESRARSNPEIHFKVFFLKIDYIVDPLMDEIHKMIGFKPTSNVMLPVFPIVSAPKARLELFHSQLKSFSKEGLHCTNPNKIYHIALVPVSSPFSDGTIRTIGYPSRDPPTVRPPTWLEDMKFNQSPKHHQTEQSNPLYNNLFPSRDPPTIRPLTCLEDAQLDQPPKHRLTAQSNPLYSNLFPPVKPPVTPLITSQETKKVNADISNRKTNTGSSEKVEGTIGHCGPTICSSTGVPEDNQFAQSAKYDIYPTMTEKKMEQATAVDNSNCRTDSGTSDQISKTDIGNQQPRAGTRDEQVCANVQVDSSKEQNLSVNQNNCHKFPTVGARIENHFSEMKKSLNEESSSNQNSEKQIPAKSTDKKDDHQSIKGEQNNDVAKSSTSPPLNNRRIAELFADENCFYSVLDRQGQPNVYLVNAMEKTSGPDLRWFVLGKSKAVPQPIDRRNHKFIILMGATGCGKSTLINGMFNYILGVEWQDPFRFKVVREDESAAGRNQAHSQTSSVTAYTLHHQKGMAVPHSITIIDTPGYGDTRGIERDKIITKTIHRFLTQTDTRIDQIHAACFVAASGDSRLTATQRYILDSVLSIFGKDVRENIRLLVTFADNADPPVVEACLAANFPVTSPSAGLTFSKFNSSVLYSSNQLKGDEDFSFDELFWDMGQENFHKFFTMLEGMNGRDLTSTREVIQRRQQVEQSLKSIELELETCLVQIENTEIFRRKLKECGHQMEANKNYAVETKEVRLIKQNSKKGFVAYNCCHCNKTCETPAKVTDSKKRKCNNRTCKCKMSDHEFQPFEWRSITITTKKTLSDVKALYESNCNQKMDTEELLNNCLNELNVAKAKVFSLLDQLGADARVLDSTALRSNALSPAEYLSLMRSQVAEEQAPGYLTRLETLTELQNYLAADATARGRLVTSNFQTTPQENITKTYGRSCGRGRGTPLQSSSDDYKEAIVGNVGNSANKSKQSVTDSASNLHSSNAVQDSVLSATDNFEDQLDEKKQPNQNESQQSSYSTIGDQQTRRGHPPGEPEDYYQAANPKEKTSSSQPSIVKEQVALIESRSGSKNENASGTEFSSDEESRQDRGSKGNSTVAMILQWSSKAISYIVKK